METPLSPLPDSTVIYRAISKKRWIADGLVDPSAFILRPKDEGYLSVLTSANCSATHCAATLKTCFGELTLSLKAVRKLGLDVIPIPLPNVPTHAGIINVPLSEGATLAQAERIAGFLAIQAQIKPKPKQ